MKRKNISETIDNINPNYIDEATEYASARESTRKKAWYKKVSPMAAAACLCLAAVVTAFVLPKIIGPYHQYKRIQIGAPTLGAETEEMLESITEVKNISVETYSDKMPVYKITPREISTDEFREFADFFGFTAEMTIDYDGLPRFDQGKTGVDEKMLRMYRNNKISYVISNGGKEDPLTLTDEELKTQAQAIFDSLPLIEGEYEYLGVTSIQTTIRGDEEFVDQKSVSFRRLIDGTRVIGNDICDLYFDSNGLCDVELTFYNYEKTGELDMLTLDDAIDKIKNPDVFGLKSETNKNFSGNPDKLTIDRTKLLFVNQYTDGCEILQPVYNLMGTAENEGGSIEFSARIIAIPEKYTYVPEKDYEQ